MAGPSPTPDLMDPLGLFTQGEFTRYDNPDPGLLLFTQGEFPRPVAVIAKRRDPGPKPGVGTGRRRRVYQPEIIRDRNEEEIIATMLLLADEEDDWW